MPPHELRTVVDVAKEKKKWLLSLSEELHYVFTELSPCALGVDYGQADAPRNPFFKKKKKSHFH